jgi:hypothetical protein
VASVIIMVVVSLLTPPPPREKTDGLTYGSIHEGRSAEEIKQSWDAGNKLMAGLILLLVGGMYLYFSFWLK